MITTRKRLHQYEQEINKEMERLKLIDQPEIGHRYGYYAIDVKDGSSCEEHHLLRTQECGMKANDVRLFLDGMMFVLRQL